jgi:hypothetical protein
MPPILIPVAITAAAGVAGVALGATTIAAATIAVGVTALTAGASYLMAPETPDIQLPDAASAAPATSSIGNAPVSRSRARQARQSLPPKRIAFGKVRVGGALFFLGNINPNLYGGVILSDGQINGVSDVYFGSEKVDLTSGAPTTGTKYDGFFEYEVAVGWNDQGESSLLNTAFTTNLPDQFWQRGAARVVYRLGYGADAEENAEVWSESITPSFLIEGVRVYDPRNPGHSISDRTTWAYSPNPALCVAHALRNMWWAALDHTAIDWDSVAAAANYCDGTISTPAGSQTRFQLAGIFESGFSIPEQITAMLASFGGALYYQDGKFHIRADEPRSSVYTITDDDIVGLGEYSAENGTAQTPTVIRSRYYDPAIEGREALTPNYVSAAEATDGRRERTVDLPFCGNKYSAQVIAFRALTQAQDGRALNITLTDVAATLEIYDTVTINSVDAAFLNGDYRVIQKDMVGSGYQLSLQGYVPGAYVSEDSYLL